MRESKAGIHMIDTNKPKNRIEFLEMIDRMLERKYENVNFNMKYDGLVVEYNSEINEKPQACFIPYPDF
jgi:hypothetical protein